VEKATITASQSKSEQVKQCIMYCDLARTLPTLTALGAYSPPVLHWLLEPTHHVCWRTAPRAGPSTSTGPALLAGRAHFLFFTAVIGFGFGFVCYIVAEQLHKSPGTLFVQAKHFGIRLVDRIQVRKLTGTRYKSVTVWTWANTTLGAHSP
jgi:hypothetical protein